MSGCRCEVLGCRDETEVSGIYARDDRSGHQCERHAYTGGTGFLPRPYNLETAYRVQARLTSNSRKSR